MVIYEVNLSVDAEVAEHYLIWLRQHIDEMLTIAGFEAAQLYRAEGESQRPLFCVHYQLQDRAALDDYLQQHAARMRSAADLSFAGRYTATRRILQPLS